MEEEQHSSSGNHGGRALAIACAEGERQGGRKRVREVWRHTGARFWSSRARGGTWHAGWMRVGHVRALYGAWLPRWPFVEHVVRVAVLDLESVFGIFRAHSDLGASSKVALLWVLYKLD